MEPLEHKISVTRHCPSLNVFIPLPQSCISPADGFQMICEQPSTQRGHFSFILPETILLLTQRQRQDLPAPISQYFS